MIQKYFKFGLILLGLILLGPTLFNVFIAQQEWKRQNKQICQVVIPFMHTVGTKPILRGSEGEVK